MKLVTALLISALAAGAGLGRASAQTQTLQAAVYHCGPDGRELRNTPCPKQPEKAPQAVSYDRPSASAVAAAKARTQAENQAADQMQRQRLAAEAQQRRNTAAKAAQPASAPASTPIVHGIVRHYKRRRLPKPPQRTDSAAIR